MKSDGVGLDHFWPRDGSLDDSAKFASIAADLSVSSASETNQVQE